MRRAVRAIAPVLLLSVALAVAGCSKPAGPTRTPPAPSSAAPTDSAESSAQAALNTMGRAAARSFEVSGGPALTFVMADIRPVSASGITTTQAALYFRCSPDAVRSSYAVNLAALAARIVPQAAAVVPVGRVKVAIVDPADGGVSVDSEIVYWRAAIDSASWSKLAAAAKPTGRGTSWTSVFEAATTYSLSERSWESAHRRYGLSLGEARFPRVKM